MTPNSSLNMGEPATRSFPRNAKEFMQAVQELFKYQYTVFVLDYDIVDETYLVAWNDRNGIPRKSWITQPAMSQLSGNWVLN